MAALFVLVLVLAVSGGAAGDDEPRLPRLKFRDATSLNGCGSSVGLHNVTSDASDVFQERLPVGGGGGGRGLTFFCPDDAWQGFVDLLSKNGCGGFAGLLSTTPNAGEIFQERLVSGGGLTVFCPDDKAVAAFDPTFRRLAVADRVAVLLYHGMAACYGRKRFKGFYWVSTVSEEHPLALHVVDAVLLPSTVACAGYLGWLRCIISPYVPVWAIPISILVGALAAMAGFLLAEFQLQVPNVDGRLRQH
uniref:Uncharacterized protein n=1 Tax=Avena sativa TaxID=4498 RepID=A0ACD5ULI4_AVESA